MGNVVVFALYTWTIILVAYALPIATAWRKAFWYLVIAEILVLSGYYAMMLSERDTMSAMAVTLVIRAFAAGLVARAGLWAVRTFAPTIRWLLSTTIVLLGAAFSLQPVLRFTFGG